MSSTAMPGLREEEADADPIVQFGRWFDDALSAGLPEPNAMTLATATPDGRPSARMVLLKGFDADGFVFFTNYLSRKGAELQANSRAALVLFWAPLQRQIRIEGTVERVSASESDAYFASRPRGSRIASAASAQSSPIPDRAALERQVADLEARFSGEEIPRPAHWGGFRVRPETIEFWHGRPSRLHDRLRYRRHADGVWERDRLSP